jgi:hypothetical protein
VSASTDYLINKGKEIQKLGAVVLRSLADDMEKADFDQIFEDNEELGINLIDGFSHLVASNMPFKMMTCAALVASGVDPEEIKEGLSREGTDQDMSFLDGIDLSSLASDTDTTTE